MASADLLALSVPEAPEGTVPAYYYITYGDAQYKLISYLASEKSALVDWGFGIEEYWVIGETATHENVIVDGLFGYTFGNIEVGEGTNAAVATLAIVRPGAIQMNLTLQSKIGINLIFNTDWLNGASVTLGEETFAIVDTDEISAQKISYAVAPNAANGEIAVVIKIAENEHKITVSVGDYAEAILASADYADAHALTYAMVVYVRAMTGDESFLADVAAPAAYAEKTLVAEASGNNGELLSSIAFCLDGTIAIAMLGTEDAEDMVVYVRFASGRGENETVTDGVVYFSGLYVNDFFGEMTIKIAGETYTYSLANYLNGMAADADKTAVQALYNYAFYADAYVQTLPKAN